MTIPLRSCVHAFPILPHSIKIQRVRSITSMKVEIQSRKLLKPSLLTPPTSNQCKIGFIDEFAPQMYVPVVLFFPPNETYSRSPLSRLEESLEKTLTLIYPLCGRYIDEIRAVDCNNQGAELTQAQVDITLKEFLDHQVDPKGINEFIPYKYPLDQVVDPLLATQVTMFKCGGFALGVEIAHRIGDASTLITILNHWTNFSRKDTKQIETIGMDFPSSSLFPSQGLSPMKAGFTNMEIDHDYVTKKLSFNKSAISKMRANGKINNNKLSKVKLVSALIWNTFIGLDTETHGHQRDSSLVQPINLRHKTASLIPENAFGNFWGLIVTSCDSTKMLKGFEELTNLLEEDLKKTIKEYSEVGHDNHKQKKKVLDSFSQYRNISDASNLIWLTSWCKFPFYSVDFGFGKPLWMSIGCNPFKRGMILVDDEEGNGVEAYVGMRIEDVPYFDQDEDIKAFCV